MTVYTLKWGDRNDCYRQWFPTKRDLQQKRAGVNKLSTKRPYDQIEILESRKVEIPTYKAGLIDWLNSNVGESLCSQS